MAFRTGSVSYARFRVVGGPTVIEDDVVGAIASNTLTPPSIGVPPEVQAGWVAGRHVFDHDFHPEAVRFGDTLLLGVRVDTNKVPAELRRVYRAMAETAVTGPGDDAPRAGQREIREETEDRCREELAAGRHRKSKMIPVLWNVPGRLLLAPAFNDTTGAVLRDLFDATFEATLEPCSAGAMAREFAVRQGRTRDYEDLAPSQFTSPPAAAHADDERDLRTPAVPWSHSGPEPKDFLGNEFLFWLWSQTELTSTTFPTPAGDVALAIDRALDMQCAWDVTGTQSLRASNPSRLPEAAKAAQIGKWPRKMGLLVAAAGEQWELTFQGDRFLVTSAKQPKPDEPPATPREAEEGRVGAVLALDRSLVALYEKFLELRLGPAWESGRSGIRRWIAERGRPATAAVADVQTAAISSV